MKKCQPVFILFLLLIIPNSVSAHRSGCHRWHSCPSDSGSYVCGDLGYTSGCPTTNSFNSGYQNYQPTISTNNDVEYGYDGIGISLDEINATNKRLTEENKKIKEDKIKCEKMVGYSYNYVKKSCEYIIIPKGARLDATGHWWECKSYYKKNKSNDACVLKGLFDYL